MAYSGASNGCVRSTAQVLPASFQSAHTIGAFIKSSAAPSTSSGFDVAMGSCGGSGQNPQANLHWDHTSGIYYKSYARRASNASYYPAQFASTPATNTWVHMLATFDGSVSRVYLNGVLDGTSGSGPTGANASAFACILGSVLSGGGYDSSSAFPTGEIAEAGYWDAVLTADEIASLVKGFRPSRVRPQNLRAYFPAVRRLLELKGGGATVVNGTIDITDHPRVFG
jgi:hypothetical protein